MLTEYYNERRDMAGSSLPTQNPYPPSFLLKIPSIFQVFGAVVLPPAQRLP